MKTIYIWMIIWRERKKYDNKKNDELKNSSVKSLFLKKKTLRFPVFLICFNK